MIPSSPSECTDESLEKEMFNSLLKLSDDYYIFHSFKTLQIESGVLEEHETDFVIFNKKFGILCIEAKAGHVFFDGIEGWKYQNGQTMHNGGPFLQAENSKWRLFRSAGECSAIKDFYKKCGFRFAVWFPSVTESELQSIPFPQNARKELVLTLDDLENPSKKIESIFSLSIENARPESLSDYEANKILNNFLCPKAKIIPTATVELDSKRMIFYRLLKEQSMILDFLDEQNSVVINGAAGSGKTLVAVEKAKRLAAQNEKVLFLCVNKELKDYLSETYQNEFIDFFTFSGYVQKITGDFKKVEEAEEFLMECLENPERFGYKHVIVDEGQDFGIFYVDGSEDNSKEMFLQILHDIVINNELGNFYVFYDKLQMIQAAKMPSFIENADCKLTLHKNCRNTENIARASLRTVSDDEKLKRQKFKDDVNIGDVSRIHFTEEKDVKNKIDEIITSRLKPLGLTEKDIVILTCETEKNNYLLRNNLLNKSSEYKSQIGNIKFSTCRKFKGLEADAIILIDVDKSTFTTREGKMLYYVGTSRAKIQLDIITTLTDEDCKELLTNEFKYTLKIKKPKRSLASVLKCNAY